MTIKEIGIIGSGQMGGGIAHVSALAGFKVKLLDINNELLEKATSLINKNLMRQVSKGKISKDQLESAISQISTTLQYKDLSDCDLVIEAATENEETKVKIFKDLCKVISKKCITNN